jgi:integrase
VADGTRTHDTQNHNLGLYQLSYSHHRKRGLF